MLCLYLSYCRYRSPVHLPVVSTYTTKCCNTNQVQKVCKILKFSQQCSSGFSPGIWCCDIGCVVPKVLKATESLKSHDPLTEPLSVTSQKTWALTLLSSFNETFLTSQVVLPSDYRISVKEIGRDSKEACSPVLRHYPFIFLKWWEWLEVKAQLRTVRLHNPNARHLECATSMLIT